MKPILSRQLQWGKASACAVLASTVLTASCGHVGIGVEEELLDTGSTSPHRFAPEADTRKDNNDRTPRRPVASSPDRRDTDASFGSETRTGTRTKTQPHSSDSSGTDPSSTFSTSETRVPIDAGVRRFDAGDTQNATDAEITDVDITEAPRDASVVRDAASIDDASEPFDAATKPATASEDDASTDAAAVLQRDAS